MTMHQTRLIDNFSRAHIYRSRVTPSASTPQNSYRKILDFVHLDWILITHVNTTMSEPTEAACT